jgi:uroporphyrinogen-III synthase
VKNALQGAHVLVTRPAHQAENLCALIEKLGGTAIRFPTMQIIGLDGHSDSKLDNTSFATQPLNLLSHSQWLIFTSANAVNFALKANGGKIAQFESAKIAAIGKTTASALQSAGLHVDVLPLSGFDSEALLAIPQMQAVNGLKILIVKGQGGREELANVLRQRGADVNYWDVYQRVIPQVDCSELINLLDQDRLSVITITSSEALQNLVVMLGDQYNKKLTMIPLVVMSNRIKKFAAETGFTRISVVECPSDEAILDAAIAVYNED